MAGDGKVLSDLAPAISELRHSRRSQPRAPSSFLSNVRVKLLPTLLTASYLFPHAKVPLDPEAAPLMTAILRLLAKSIQFELGPSVGKDLVRFRIARG
jgi:hypothetical protein